MKRIIILLLSASSAIFLHAQTDLSLKDCREMALQNDVKVKNVGLDVLAANAMKQEAVTEFFPRVSVSTYGFMAASPMLEIGVKDIFGESVFSNNLQVAVDYLGSLFGFPSVFTALQSGYSASVTAIQPLYAGGRIVNGNRLASLGKNAAMLQEDVTVRSVLENVDRSYWKVVALQEKIKTLNAASAFLNNLYNDVSAAVDAGLALDTDLLQVQLRRDELRKSRLALTGGIRLAKMNLFNSIGQPYSLVSGLPYYIDDISLSEDMLCVKSPDEYYIPDEEIVSGLSETELLDLAVEEKRLKKKMTIGESLPQVGIGMAGGYSKILDSRFNAVAFAMIRIPVSDWGETSRKIKRLDYEMQKAQNERDYLTSQLLLQVRSLWLDLNVAWENICLAEQDMNLAQIAADRMCDQYDAGIVTLTDLLQAEMQLRTRRDAYIESLTGYASTLASYVSRSQRSFSKCSTPTPQAGHTQPSGRSSNGVPTGTPPSGSPSAGS